MQPAFVVRESQDRLRAGVLVEPAGPGVSLVSAAAVLVESNGRIAARWTASDATRRPLLGAMAGPAGNLPAPRGGR